MDYITYIIVALIPALAVVFVVYTFIKKSNEKELTNMSIQLKQERQKFFLEPRADAYQRVVLLLERINPHSLIMRLHNTNKSALSFQTEILNNIRNEFDHNVAQQIFISNSSWEIVKKSKEETIKIINVAAQQLDENATATDLSAKVFEIIGNLDELPTEIAIKVLKEEFQRLF
ncbi:MAG TPA: hypothetical protein VKX29_02765 [Brumimicrobium sp.]|nr:hypothetical protein [Brumimicrobium sp.]